MKKTFVTIMPNHIGAFLKASKCFASLGVNITRVSYNKAVDSHYLFIDAEGTEEQLEKASQELEKIGYLQDGGAEKNLILLEFKLKDEPGSVTALLELIAEYCFNISYISSQENGSDFQLFKMGLLTDDHQRFGTFVEKARKLCAVRTIDYNHADKVFDNSLFYSNFVSEISSFMNISEKMRETLLVNVNLAMQQLDESGVSPYRTFDSISRFTELLSASRGQSFNPRVSRHEITPDTEVILIEPPCGSNTAILHSQGKYLFVDTGYACYSEEMNHLFRSLVPGFDAMEKEALITHADVDHCGLLQEFDRIYASPRSAECLRREYEKRDGFREQNRLHKPYITICKVLTSYAPPTPDRLTVIGTEVNCTEPLTHIGFFNFGEMHFELFEGKGGHLVGETIFIDYNHRVVFSGDVFVNMKNMTAEQAQYNRYAPILMTSVDTDRQLCAEEREALFQRLGLGTWHIFCGHGGEKLYKLAVTE